MEQSSVFKTNCNQAVRLPKAVALPDDVKRRFQGSVRHMAALPGPLHEKRPGACVEERTARRLGLHRHGLRPGDIGSGQRTVA